MIKYFSKEFANEVFSQTRFREQKKQNKLNDYLAQKEILKLCGYPEFYDQKKLLFNFKKPRSLKATLIVPTPFAASTALHNILAAEEEIYIPWKVEIDEAILNNKTFCLQKKFFRNFLLGKKNTIVQHSYVAGTQCSVNCLPILKKLCRKDLFIHSVRSPMDCFISALNNELIQKSGAGYFPAIIKNSVFHRQVLENLDEDPSLKDQAKSEYTKERLITACFIKTKDQARNFKIGSVYKKEFGQWIPIDICHQNIKLMDEDVKKLNCLLGTKIKSCDITRTSHASRFTSYFGKNKTKLKIGSFTTPSIGLGLAGTTYNKNLFDESELIWLNEKYPVPFSDQKKELCLTIDSKEFLDLSKKDKTYLLNKDVLIAIFNLIYPRWFKEAEICHNFQENLKANSFDVKKDEKIYYDLCQDTLKFCALYPKFYSRWKTKGIFL